MCPDARLNPTIHGRGRIHASAVPMPNQLQTKGVWGEDQPRSLGPKGEQRGFCRGGRRQWLQPEGHGEATGQARPELRDGNGCTWRKETTPVISDFPYKRPTTAALLCCAGRIERKPAGEATNSVVAAVPGTQDRANASTARMASQGAAHRGRPMGTGVAMCQ